MHAETVRKIRRLSQQYAYTSLQMHEAIARKAGFSGTDHKYLGFLLQKGPMTAGELAQLSGLTTGAVTGLIDRFEKKKLVKRQASREDRRSVNIVPDTKKIMALLEPLYRQFRNASENLIASFSDDEVNVLEKYFSVAVEIMNDTTNRISNKKL